MPFLAPGPRMPAEVTEGRLLPPYMPSLGGDLLLLFPAPPVPMLSLLASCASFVMSGSFSMRTSPPVILEASRGEASGDRPGVTRRPMGLWPLLPRRSGTVRLVRRGSTCAALLRRTP